MKADPASHHPFYWAGFVLLGDGDAAIPLEKRAGPSAWLIAGGAAALALALLLARRRR
ncbi:MAG: LPXTG cell wall anchor domain-containing protein [Candidatus Krumholzibacteriia bacterium]